MKKIVSLMLLLLLFCSGCERVGELDEKSFVTAIGFDRGENYPLRFTFIFTTPTKSSKSSNPEEKDETIVIEAPSLYSAIEEINNFKSKSIELTHTQTIVFSEELAKDGIEEYIYMLVRSSHFRPNTYICIADKSSMTYLENINPTGVYHLEKFFQLLFNKMTAETKGDMYLYDSYFRLKSEPRTGVLPYCAINETTLILSDEEKDSETPTLSTDEEATIEGKFARNTDDFGINTIAGNTISISDNTSQIQGVAVMKDGFLVSKLGRLETICLQMITGSMPKTYFTLSNPQHPNKMITCFITQTKQPKIDVKCGDEPKISISIDLEGDFSAVGSTDYYIEHPSDFEAYFESKAEEAINRFLEKIIKEDCDICAFSDVAKGNFLRATDWTDYNWREKYKTSEYEVEVNLTMRTYGELAQKARSGQ